MGRLPVPGSDDGVWGSVLNDFLSVEHNTDGTLKASGSLNNVVHKTGAETIDGVKTFSSAVSLNNGSNLTIPTVPATGLLNFMGTHLMFFGDDDGDGDYDYDIRSKDNMYLAADAAFHFRPKYPQGGPEYGRLVIDADATALYMQYGLNFAGTTFTDFAISKYGTTFRDLFIDESQNGYMGLGFASGKVAQARLHVYDGAQTLALFEGTATTARITFRASGTAGTTTVGIGATGDDLILRSGGSNRATLTSTGEFAVTGKVTGVVDPTAAQDAATKNYVDAMDATAVHLAGAETITGTKIFGPADGTSAFIVQSIGLTTTLRVDTQNNRILIGGGSAPGSTLNVNGNSYFGGSATSSTARVDAAASTTTIASMRIRSGVAPTTPNSGDIWFDGSHTYIRIGTANTQLDNVGAVPTEVTGTSQALVSNQRYIANNAGLVTLTLPATAAVGDQFLIRGKGAGGWRVAQNASQVIHATTDTTSGTGGSISSTARYDCVVIECITANTDFVIASQKGTLTTV